MPAKGLKCYFAASVSFAISGPSTKNSYKIGADTSVIVVAAVFDGVAMIGKATRHDGEYPDGAVGGAGLPVEVYNNGDAKQNYAELELLSPLLF